eukprot:3859358-Pyramimonas_sp.AAC.1
MAASAPLARSRRFRVLGDVLAHDDELGRGEAELASTRKPARPSKLGARRVSSGRQRALKPPKRRNALYANRRAEQ